MDTAFLVFRLLNIALGLLCLFLCLTKASRHWGQFNPTAKGFVMSLTVFSFATVWGTGEQIAQGVEPGSRVLIASVALINLLYALWSTRGQSFYAEFKPENRAPRDPWGNE
jgi:predicted nucleic-acid-binding protein